MNTENEDSILAELDFTDMRPTETEAHSQSVPKERRYNVYLGAKKIRSRVTGDFARKMQEHWSASLSLELCN